MTGIIEDMCGSNLQQSPQACTYRKPYNRSKERKLKAFSKVADNSRNSLWSKRGVGYAADAHAYTKKCVG